MIAHLEHGYSLREIATRLGCSVTTVHRRVRACGDGGGARRRWPRVKRRRPDPVFTLSDIAAAIRRGVNPIQQEICREWVALPGTQPEAWGGIFCGWAKDGPWIFEVDVSGPSQFQDPFAATGSGHPLAHTALVGVTHFDVGHQSLEGAKAIVYRAIESTCLASAYGVGMPVQMAIITAAGVEELVVGDEGHRDLRVFVDLWKAKEVETLGGLAPSKNPGACIEATGKPELSIDEAEIPAGT